MTPHWKTKDGKLMKLSEMTDNHIANSIAYLERQGKDATLLKKEQSRRGGEFDPNDSNPDHALTFEEWSSTGYRVKKGAKAVSKNILGESEFLPNQVWKARNKTMWEQHTERAMAKGTPWGVVSDFDSFVREAGMLPDGKAPVFAINDPMERMFMEVADKHGILDMVIDGDY